MDLPRRALLLAAAGLSTAAGSGPATLVCPLVTAPPVLIPGMSNSLATRLVGGQLYRGLLRWGRGGTLEPDLATIELSPDGLTYTAQLRPGVTWHDSGGLDADDVAFSLTRFHRVLQPALGLGRLTVDTLGPLTVVLTLPAPDPAFLRQLEALSLPIVPRHVHDRAGWALNPRDMAPVGTGPFRYDGWLRLVRFEWFAGAKPSLLAVEFPILPDPGARTALAAGAGPVLLVGDAVDLSSMPRLRAVAGLTVDGEYSSVGRTVAGLQLNIGVRPLDQFDVRLGLACGIDRVAAVRDGWSGLGRAATGPLAGDSATGNGAAALPDYNPRVAAEHLRAAGLRPDDTGIRARLGCLHPPGPSWPPMLASVRRSLAQIGVDLTAEAVTEAEWARRVAAGEYQVAVFAMDRMAALAQTTMTLLPLVEPAVPVVRPAALRLPRGALGSFEGAALD